MSAAPERVPRSAWAAAGAAGGAGIAWLGGDPLLVLAGGLLLLAFGLAGPRMPRLPATAAAATAIGAIFVAARLLVGPPAPAPPPLPDGSGPWTAEVESVGSSRDGSQVARLVLDVSPGPVTVAATLPAFPPLRAGALVETGGRLRPPPDDDPYGEYLRRTGAAGSLLADRVRVLRQPDAGSLQALRDGAGDALRLAMPEPEAGLAAGILIGLRERVDRALAADFATSGTSHVVAISGWNIAIVAGLVGAVLRGRSRRMLAIAVGGTIAAYTVAAGGSPSVVRAAVMAAVVLTARESGRAGRAPAALALAALLLLLAEPAMIGDAGFRLSVTATAGLLAWATPLGRWLGRLGGGRMPPWLAESLGISLAAQAATLPDVLLTFGRLSLVAPVVNLLVVPLVPAAMAAGVVAMIGGALAMVRPARRARHGDRTAGLAGPARHGGGGPRRRGPPVRRRSDPAGGSSGGRGPGRRGRPAGPHPVAATMEDRRCASSRPSRRSAAGRERPGRASGEGPSALGAPARDRVPGCRSPLDHRPGGRGGTRDSPGPARRRAGRRDPAREPGWWPHPRGRRAGSGPAAARA